jgi:hypothetical protein
VEHIAPVLVLFALAFLAGWIVWVVSNHKRRSRVEAGQAEMQTKLLDKFGSSEELMAYLQSEPGQRFLQPPPMDTKSPYGRILGSIRWGVILTFLGIGFLIVRGYAPEPEPFLFLGTVTLALGLGFLVSSGISYALSKSWGLFDS